MQAATSTPWRVRMKRRTLLPAEKAARRERYLTTTRAMQDFHKATVSTVWDRSVEAAERFPQHSARQHFRRIMSQPTIAAHKRAPNIWIAFSRNEVKNINDGTVSVVLLQCMLTQVPP